jgi:hypothetical protein
VLRESECEYVSVFKEMLCVCVYLCVYVCP